MSRPHLASVVRLVIAASACVWPTVTHAQGPFAPRRIDSFENPTGVSRYQTTGEVIFLGVEQSTIGVTHGLHSMLLEMEGSFDLPCPDCVVGWGSGTAVRGDYAASDVDLSGYAAFQAAAADPRNWTLKLDVTTTPESWTSAPPTSTSIQQPGDIGPNLARLRIDVGRDGAIGPGYSTINFYGNETRRTLAIPFSQLVDSQDPLPGAAVYSIGLGGDAMRFNGEPPGGAKFFFDNIRLQPAYPQIRDVIWDFESDFATFQGWSDKGRSGVDTSHKHSIVTGLGATSVSSGGVVTPAPAGHGLLIDTSNIPSNANGFQWGSAMTLNADADNNGVVDNAATKTRISDLVGRMKRAVSIEVDATFHDSVPNNPIPGLPPAVVPGEANAPWLKLVLGVEFDSTPANGAISGLVANQYDNEFATDALGHTVQTSRGDMAASLTTEMAPGDGMSPEEPLTFTFPISQIGNLKSLLNGGVADASNFMRFTFVVQTGSGDNTILAVLDNIRFVTSPTTDADFDYDGDVDGDDLTVWQTWHLTPGLHGNADADGDGDADGDDLLVWQRQSGNDATPAVSLAAQIPEPASLFLALLAGMAWVGRMRT